MNPAIGNGQLEGNQIAVHDHFGSTLVILFNHDVLRTHKHARAQAKIPHLPVKLTRLT